MSVDETLRAVDGVLSARPEAWLAADVELVEPWDDSEISGRPEVVVRIREVFSDAADVRLTLDEGRGVAEWSDAANGVVCVFEVENGLVRAVRLYRDPTAAGPIDRGDG